MKAREFAKEIHLTLTVEEFDMLYEIFSKADWLYSDIPDVIFAKMKEIKRRLDFEVTSPPSQGGRN